MATPTKASARVFEREGSGSVQLLSGYVPIKVAARTKARAAAEQVTISAIVERALVRELARPIRDDATKESA